MRMRRSTGVFLLIAGTMAVVLLGARVPEALAGMETFRVRAVHVEGTRYLDPAQVEELAGLSADASVWDDMEPVARRVRAHGLVADADVRRKLPAGLVLQVREREPVALLPTPVLAPVDREGRLLPLDPARHRMDLPVLHPAQDGSIPKGSVSDRPESADGATPGRVRLMAGEVARLAETDPGLLASLSEVALLEGGDVVLRFLAPAVELRYRPPLNAARLREGLRVLSDAAERRPEESPSGVDLRYRDQVVVRFEDSNGR